MFPRGRTPPSSHLTPYMGRKPRTQRAVAKLAATQYGVVSGVQMGQLGWGEDAIARELAAGRLHGVHRGVYAVGHPAISDHGRARAAVLACGEGAVLSHESAAWLWGIAPVLAQRIEVTATVPRHHQPLIRLHSSRALLDGDRTESERVPVTSVARTLLDLAARSSRRLPYWLQRASRLGILDLIEVDELLRRSKGMRGVARLRAGLEGHRLPEFTRSNLERRFLALLREAGVPRPSVNCFVAGFELDFYWDELRFAVELDTYEHHGDQLAFERDRLRQEDLKLAGIEMDRITGQRIDREPTAVIARLRRLLEMRSADLARAHPHR